MWRPIPATRVCAAVYALVQRARERRRTHAPGVNAPLRLALAAPAMAFAVPPRLLPELPGSDGHGEGQRRSAVQLAGGHPGASISLTASLSESATNTLPLASAATPLN